MTTRHRTVTAAVAVLIIVASVAAQAATPAPGGECTEVGKWTQGADGTLLRCAGRQELAAPRVGASCWSSGVGREGPPVKTPEGMVVCREGKFRLIDDAAAKPKRAK